MMREGGLPESTKVLVGLLFLSWTCSTWQGVAFIIQQQVSHYHGVMMTTRGEKFAMSHYVEEAKPFASLQLELLSSLIPLQSSAVYVRESEVDNEYDPGDFAEFSLLAQYSPLDQQTGSTYLEQSRQLAEEEGRSSWHASPLHPSRVLDTLYDLEPLALHHGEPYRIGRTEGCWGFPLVYDDDLLVGWLLLYTANKKKIEGQQLVQARLVASSLALMWALADHTRNKADKQIKDAGVLVSSTLEKIRSPLSALRTFGKVLTRRLAREEGMNGELARNIMVQSDRLAELLVPLTAAAVGMLNPSPSSQVVQVLPPTLTMPEAEQAALLADGEEAWTPKLCWLEDVVMPILEAGAAIAHRDDIEFSYSLENDLPALVLDPRALQEALSNILENALTYVLVEGGPPLPQVTVQVYRDMRGDREAVVVEVVDNGIGIHPEDLPHIFEPGFRGRRTVAAHGDSSSSSSADYLGDEDDDDGGSCGMGLTLAKDLLLQIGGDIEVEPGQLWGVRVAVILYPQPNDTPPIAGTPNSSSDRSNAQIP